VRFAVASSLFHPTGAYCRLGTVVFFLRWSIPSNGLSPGPLTVTSKYRIFSSCGTAVIPGDGSACNLSDSFNIRFGSDIYMICGGAIWMVGVRKYRDR